MSEGNDTALAATGFVELISQCAAQAGVPVLRSAAFAAIAAAPPTLWVVLQSAELQQLVVRLRGAATDDRVPATRAQAVNALQGIVVDVSSVAALGTELDGVVAALAAACSDASASVRGVSAAALAALCTTLRDSVYGVRQDGAMESSTADPTVFAAVGRFPSASQQLKKEDRSTVSTAIHTEGNIRDGVVVEESQPEDDIGASACFSDTEVVKCVDVHYCMYFQMFSPTV